MKRSTFVAIGIAALLASVGAAQAADIPVRQEGRVWVYQPLTLVFSPNWSLTSMPGGRVEFARAREAAGNFHFLEYFVGPNYTYKTGNLTVKASLWYYFMGYPQRGRTLESGACSKPEIGTASTCTSVFNLSHNIELIPTVEYRVGKWTFTNRIILHNTFYADVYGAEQAGVSVSDQRLGFGTVLREMLQVRYAVTEKVGIVLADEPFFGLIEDGDTKDLPLGYTPLGYWKRGYRLNRTYVGMDFKITPAFSVTPMYMLEVMSNPKDSADVTDMSHNLYVTVSYAAKLFGDK